MGIFLMIALEGLRSREMQIKVLREFAQIEGQTWAHDYRHRTHIRNVGRAGRP